jgi:hypothetical protein
MMLFFRREIAVVAGILLLAGSIAKADDLEEKPVVKGGISIRLPKGWQVAEREPALLVARASARDKDPQGEFRALLTITSSVNDKVDAAKQQAQAAREFRDYKAEEKPEAIEINGLSGAKFGGTMSTGSVRVRSRQYLLQRDNRVYTLTFMCLATYWKSYEPIIEACAATFSIPAK